MAQCMEGTQHSPIVVDVGAFPTACIQRAHIAPTTPADHSNAWRNCTRTLVSESLLRSKSGGRRT
jgi:hypothetical protein